MEPESNQRQVNAGLVSESMIGSRTPPSTVRWTERDAMLYALGVGAGLGTGPDGLNAELHYTTDNSESVILEVVPSFIGALTLNVRPPAHGVFGKGRTLHAEQRIELPAPLPVAGEAQVVNEVVSVLDKGSGAIVVTRATLHCTASAHLLGTVYSSTFVQGAGGFGGPRGGSSEWSLPNRAPDASVVQPTRPDQALLYRLSGDSNPLHSDPLVAQRRGFKRPILHGLCIFGMACRALIAVAGGGETSRLRAMEGRFRKPAWPGDMLTTQVWGAENGAVQYRMIDASGEVVIDRGTALLSE